MGTVSQGRQRKVNRIHERDINNYDNYAQGPIESTISMIKTPVAQESQTMVST